MNRLVKELKNSFIASLNKTADILNISSDKAASALNSIFNKVELGFKTLDEACTEYGNILVNMPIKEEKEPEGFTLIFSGKNGGKIYCTKNPSDKLIINDELLVTRDLQALNKSFYAEDYQEASRLTRLIRENGVITSKEYKK